MSNKIVKFVKNCDKYVKGDIAGFEAGDAFLERVLDNGSAVPYKAKDEAPAKTAEELEAEAKKKEEDDAKAEAKAKAKAEKDAKK
jgi:hypothetical protein